MVWARIDDQFPDHPKVAMAGGDAAWLFVCGLCYASRHLTDGRIPKAVVRQLTDRRNPEALAARLVEVNLWADGGDHYTVHDWDAYNEPADSVRSRRDEKAKARSDRASRAARAR